MAEFILVDLRSQMPYLPREMRTWGRERIVRWLRLYGEVYCLSDEVESQYRDLFTDTYAFCSWAGLSTGFILTESGEMYIPGTKIRAWPENPE